MPEYETIFALGPMLGISNPEALILANDLCDLLGMDTISMGVTLASVAEALERGWLKGLSIGYATATRGGSHHDTRPTPQYAAGFDRRSPKDKPAFAMRSQHFTAVGDSLVMCRFTSERGSAHHHPKTGVSGVRWRRVAVSRRRPVSPNQHPGCPAGARRSRPSR